MNNQIKIELNRLEQQYDIKILYAVESGSRAWGFASLDSDWDIRFIYLHTLEWYLSIDEKPDTIEMILPNNLDFSGWDLRKTLKLFRKSNPPLLEWLQSPIVYHQQYNTIGKLRELAAEYFDPKSCMYHYFNMGVGNFREYLQKDIVRLKKYFYVLRPILACQWIEQTGTMPPMEFKKLVDTQISDKRLKIKIEQLLMRKTNGEELSEGPKIQIINEFLSERIDYFKQYLQLFQSLKPVSTYKLDELFRSSLWEVYK